MKVIILRDRRRLRTGEIHEFPDGVANVFIKRGFAKLYEEEKPVRVQKNYYRKAVVHA